MVHKAMALEVNYEDFFDMQLKKIWVLFPKE